MNQSGELSRSKRQRRASSLLAGFEISPTKRVSEGVNETQVPNSKTSSISKSKKPAKEKLPEGSNKSKAEIVKLEKNTESEEQDESKATSTLAAKKKQNTKKQPVKEQADLKIKNVEEKKKIEDLSSFVISSTPKEQKSRGRGMKQKALNIIVGDQDMEDIILSPITGNGKSGTKKQNSKKLKEKNDLESECSREIKRTEDDQDLSSLVISSTPKNPRGRDRKREALEKPDSEELILSPMTGKGKNKQSAQELSLNKQKDLQVKGVKGKKKEVAENQDSSSVIISPTSMNSKGRGGVKKVIKSEEQDLKDFSLSPVTEKGKPRKKKENAEKLPLKKTKDSKVSSVKGKKNATADQDLSSLDVSSSTKDFKRRGRKRKVIKSEEEQDMNELSIAEEGKPRKKKQKLTDSVEEPESEEEIPEKLSASGRALRKAAVKARMRVSKCAKDAKEFEEQDEDNTDEYSRSDVDYSNKSDNSDNDDEDDDDDVDDEDVGDDDITGDVCDEDDTSLNYNDSKRVYQKVRISPMDLTRKVLAEIELKDLFPDWMPSMEHFQEISFSDGEKFLPKNQDMAFKVQTGKKSVTPKKNLDLFEVFESLDTFNINVGGPVWALAWCPTPLANSSMAQYLAVYTHQTATEVHQMNSVTNKEAVIQFWNFGSLRDKISSVSPVLEFCLVLDCGPVWELKWCPTGARTSSKTDLSRIGLLAVASHSGSVQILSIPKFSHECGAVKLYRVNPVAILKNNNGGESTCLCLDWHVRDNCSTIIAGFGDGGISLWDLSSKSKLIFSIDENGSCCFKPFNSFQGHIYPVSGVAFCQMSIGFFVTCSHDKCEIELIQVNDSRSCQRFLVRTFKLWNISEPGVPLLTYRFLWSTSVVWPLIHPTTFCVGSEEACQYQRNSVVQHRFHYGKLESKSLSLHNATVWNMSVSNWLNMLLSCDSSGSVLVCPWVKRSDKSSINKRKVLFLTELLYLCDASEQDVEKTVSDDGAPGECKCQCHQVVVNNLDPTDSDRTSKECPCCKKCLLFKDYNTNWKYDKSLAACKDLPVDDIIKSQFCAQHRVCWNPNAGSHDWLAAGGQSGLLRVKLAKGIIETKTKKARKPYKTKKSKMNS